MEFSVLNNQQFGMCYCVVGLPPDVVDTKNTPSRSPFKEGPAAQLRRLCSDPSGQPLQVWLPRQVTRSCSCQGSLLPVIERERRIKAWTCQPLEGYSARQHSLQTSPWGGHGFVTLASLFDFSLCPVPPPTPSFHRY